MTLACLFFLHKTKEHSSTKGCPWTIYVITYVTPKQGGLVEPSSNQLVLRRPGSIGARGKGR